MPESFTCHQCHRSQWIGRRHWTKYQPVYSEGPPWAGGEREEGERVCLHVGTYSGLWLWMQRVRCVWARRLCGLRVCDNLKQGVTPQRSDNRSCLWEFYSPKQTVVRTNARDYESSNRCTADNVSSVIRPQPLLCCCRASHRVHQCLCKYR